MYIEEYYFNDCFLFCDSFVLVFVVRLEFVSVGDCLELDKLKEVSSRFVVEFLVIEVVVIVVVIVGVVLIVKEDYMVVIVERIVNNFCWCELYIVE